MASYSRVWGNGLATEGATAVLAFQKGIEAIYSFYRIICLLEK